jgi:glycosyltransferase involved in cell wall biosynthesis
MRIMIAVHGYPPDQFGGAERRAERTARAMAARGHEVTVFCIQTDNADHPDLRTHDVLIDGIRVRRVAFNGGANPDPFRWSYDHPELGAALADLIAEARPQVMHLFSGYLLGASAIDAAVEYDVRVIVELTDYWWHCHRINLLTPLGERCDGPSPVRCTRCYAEQQRRFRLPTHLAPGVTNQLWSAIKPETMLGDLLGMPAQEQRARRLHAALEQAAMLIAPSQYLADFYVRHGAHPEQIRVWRQGVELDYCRLRTRSETLRVGYIGQVKPHKGVDLILRAWSLLHGTQPRQLDIYGSAEGDPRYHQQIEHDIGLLHDAAWRGAFRGPQVWEVLAQLDVVVVPSRWVENSPNSILEAQAVGVAVVGSNLGGIAELVRHNHNGLLFAVDDAQDLARNLQRLLDEPDLLARLRKNALPFLSHTAAMDRLEHLYEETISAPFFEQHVG